MFSEIINKYFSYLRGKSIENPNVTKSLILHFCIVLAVSGMLPTCTRKIEKPKVISVDIMPMGPAEKTAPKPTQPQEVKKEPPKQEPKPLPPKEVKKPAEAVKMEKAEKPKPVAKPDEKKPAPKKVEKKPEPEKKKQDKQKKDDRDQEGKKKLLKDLEKKEQAKLDDIFEQAAEETITPVSQVQNSGKSDVIDPALVNEIRGKLQQQVIENWSIPIGVKDVQSMQVGLYIALTPQGAVTEVKIMDQIQYSTDNKYRVMADSAFRAVKEASPFKGLPADKYELWKEIEFNFNPADAL
jgi:outer membrane biosynthesis protein TonB